MYLIPYCKKNSLEALLFIITTAKNQNSQHSLWFLWLFFPFAKMALYLTAPQSKHSSIFASCLQKHKQHLHRTICFLQRHRNKCRTPLYCTLMVCTAFPVYRAVLHNGSVWVAKWSMWLLLPKDNQSPNSCWIRPPTRPVQHPPTFISMGTELILSF